MKFRLGIPLILLLLIPTASAQSINFSSSRYEAISPKSSFHRETSRIEKFLAGRYPNTTLRSTARTKVSPILRKVTYEVVYQGGIKYLVAVFTSRWAEPVNQLAIYQMSGEKAGERAWRSKSWTSNYYGNSLSTFKSGNRSIFLFKEGGIMPGDFGLASLFSIGRYDGKTFVKDHTPANSPLAVKTTFPFRAILGQNIQLTPTAKAGLTLAASESMYRYEDQYYQAIHEWRYNRTRNNFERIELSTNKLSKSD